MDKETAYRLYEPMLKTRRLDERMRRLFRQGRFKGTYFSAIGQEATNVGAGIHMLPDDMLAPSHRQLGAMIAKGISLKRVMAQVYSKAESPDGAHQHPCHFGDPELNIISPTGHVAIQILMGVGSAYGFLLEAAQEGKVKINWDPDGIVWAGRWTLAPGTRLRCALAFFGEGATAKGDFHESLNFAAIHNLPIVYICENNLWAESVHASENFALEDYSERAKGYGMPGISIDGNDIVYHGYFDIGVAVGSPRGLVVPVLRNADQMTFAEIEKKIAEFGQKARDGKLGLEELTGGTFSISNGGTFGSMLSTPIINPPQSAILGVHATKDRAVVENGQVVVRPINYLAMSYDHRIIDGREAVLGLVAMKEALEEPARLLFDI
ncbi:MAG: 2-oxo acid dehydrogenase subunit E2 [Proteobacteria bacterium]|nr:2-oxo acid dehydrogenase subunit E2 [Pseudomonadota bacterium]